MVSICMKRDGRTLDHQTLETIRLMAIERVREGERPSEVIEAYGFNRTTIYKWIKTAFGSGGGIKALRSTTATGCPRSLTLAQERRVFGWINGRDPRQYGLDFGLWTRIVVAELIEKKFGVRLGVSAVGELLAGLGLPPQKPLQRAYQRDPQAVEKWQRETYPPLPVERRHKGPRYFSGTSPDFAPTPCMGRPGEHAVTPRWLNARDSASRSVLPLR